MARSRIGSSRSASARAKRAETPSRVRRCESARGRASLSEAAASIASRSTAGSGVSIRYVAGSRSKSPRARATCSGLPTRIQREERAGVPTRCTNSSSLSRSPASPSTTTSGAGASRNTASPGLPCGVASGSAASRISAARCSGSLWTIQTTVLALNVPIPAPGAGASPRGSWAQAPCQVVLRRQTRCAKSRVDARSEPRRGGDGSAPADLQILAKRPICENCFPTEPAPRRPVAGRRGVCELGSSDWGRKA